MCGAFNVITSKLTSMLCHFFAFYCTGYKQISYLSSDIQITSSAASDLNIKGDSKAIIRGNEGVNIMGRTVEFKMGGDIELRAVSKKCVLDLVKI